MEKATKFFNQIIKADPGYYALDIGGVTPKNPAIRLFREPVIAWFISVELDNEYRVSVAPICAAQLGDLYQGAIERPDGSVDIWECDFWPSVDEYETYVKRSHGNVQTAVMTTLCSQEASHANR